MLLLESKFVFAIVCCCEKALLQVVPEFGYVGEDKFEGDFPRFIDNTSLEDRGC